MGVFLANRANLQSKRLHDQIFADLEDDDQITEIFVSINECFESKLKEYLAELVKREGLERTL